MGSPRNHDHPAVHIQRQPHHRQHEHRPGSASAFRWSVILNSALSALQLVIGFGFGSLALIGDAIHNLGDVAGLLFGWGAERLSSRPVRGRFTYGFGRSTQLASLANAVLILMASAVVMMEGVQRLIHPQEVVSGPVAWAAAAGIAVNLGSARLFGGDHHHEEGDDLAVEAPVDAGEGHQGQVDRVEHQLDAHEDHQCVAAHEHADRTDQFTPA